MPVPAGFRVQPIDADDVAAKLVELALSEPAGRVPDVGGPHVATAAELVRASLQTIGRRRRVIQVWIPGIRTIRAGGLLLQEPAQAFGDDLGAVSSRADQLNPHDSTSAASHPFAVTTITTTSSTRSPLRVALGSREQRGIAVLDGEQG